METTIESSIPGIGEIILHQMGGARRVCMMTGAKAFTLLPKGVSFRFPNPERSKGNMLEVVLDPSDTYTLRFYNVVGASKKLVRELSDVYCDMLVDIFERQTGLYLRF